MKYISIFVYIVSKRWIEYYNEIWVQINFMSENNQIICQPLKLNDSFDCIGAGGSG